MKSYVILDTRGGGGSRGVEVSTKYDHVVYERSLIVKSFFLY